VVRVVLRVTRIHHVVADAGDALRAHKREKVSMSWPPSI